MAENNHRLKELPAMPAEPPAGSTEEIITKYHEDLKKYKKAVYQRNYYLRYRERAAANSLKDLDIEKLPIVISLRATVAAQKEMIEQLLKKTSTQ
jgi:hypothetical protein